MTNATLRNALTLGCTLALLAGCPGDDSPATSTTGEDTGSTGGTNVTSLPTDPTNMTTPTDPTVDPDSSGGPGTTDPTNGTTDGGTTDGGTTDGGTTDGGTTGDTGATDSGSTGSTGSTGGMGLCEDVDLGSMLPVAEVGTTVGAVDDFEPSCTMGAGNDEDSVYLWTAPADGLYGFSTFGSDIDTILTLLASCDGTEIDCNDDAEGTDSLLLLDMLAGESVWISVDGYGESGDFVLNITDVGNNGAMGFGDCVTMSVIDACIIPGEQCFTDMGPTVGVCTAVGCAVDADCPPAPPGGNAPVICQDVNLDMVAEECSLDCSAGQTCPTGMGCSFNFICTWPA
jgi:hypothetical protein